MNRFFDRLTEYLLDDLNLHGCGVDYNNGLASNVNIHSYFLLGCSFTCAALLTSGGSQEERETAMK